jgi:hypothetical protein
MDIKARILARRDLDELRAVREIDALAAALNTEGLTAPTSRYVTMRTILAECPSGREIVTALRQAAAVDPIVDESVNFLRRDSGFDIGHAETAEDIARLVDAGVFSPVWADEVHALSLRPVVVTRDQVNDAMFNPDGSEK